MCVSLGKFRNRKKKSGSGQICDSNIYGERQNKERSHNMFPNVSTVYCTATKRSNLCYFVITIGYGSHLKTLFITYTINALSFLYIMSFQNINNIDVFLYNVTQCAFAICSRLRTIWFGQKRGTWEWQQHKRLSKTLLTNQRPKRP